MSTFMEFPLETEEIGGKQEKGTKRGPIFEVEVNDVPGALVLAAPSPGEVTARASQSLEQALSELTPSLRGILANLRQVSPTELSVEFGLKAGGEAGLIFAKGKVEANLVVKLSWSAKDDEQK